MKRVRKSPVAEVEAVADSAVVEVVARVGSAIAGKLVY
jgi:hypothetical protein